MGVGASHVDTAAPMVRWRCSWRESDGIFPFSFFSKGTLWISDEVPLCCHFSLLFCVIGWNGKGSKDLGVPWFLSPVGLVSCLDMHLSFISLLMETFTIRTTGIQMRAGCQEQFKILLWFLLWWCYDIVMCRNSRIILWEVWGAKRFSVAWGQWCEVER